MQKIILASSSKYRQALLANLGIEASTIAPQIDETPRPEETGEQLALRLAIAKSEKIGQHHPEAVTIGSDQVAVLTHADESFSLMGKPGTIDNAVAQLRACAGNRVTFYTAVSLYTCERQVSAVEATEVWFCPLTEAAIRAYVEFEQPLDCAGSFKCEGVGALLFERIDGRDPNSLIGLPTMLLRDLFARLDIDLLALATTAR
ncbi:septum formation protein Maf [Salinimonas marina]|uniref:7-methyl-GTP pyrophosphatase n=1 Tax=Salinimonas marina TaxID=2785918 RepID=A0A7S9DV10_9ALTE|nr:Maf family protein [Salinimonas marina]QPG04469.1 septum formation protein Maf [Salinimonas marina]